MEIRPVIPTDFEAVLAFAERGGTTRAHLAAAWDVEGTERLVAIDGDVQGYATLDSGGDIRVAGVEGPTYDALLAASAERARGRGLRQLVAVVPPGDGRFDTLVRRGGFAARGEVLEMERDLAGTFDAPRWPDGVAVRTYDDSDALTVHAFLDEAYGAWDETYVAWPHDDWLTFMTQHEAFDPGFWHLAERDGQLVGCALTWSATDPRGWVKDIAVRADERGRGLATALLLHAFRAYAERGVTRVGLKVDSTNPTGAVQLYERVGFTVERRHGIWVKRL